MFPSLRTRAHRLLRLSERYFKTDMVYLASGGFWLTAGQTLSTLSVLLLGIAFANFVPKDIYGTYKYALSVAGLFSIFALSGMGTALTRSIARGFGGSMHLATMERMRWGFVGAVLCLGIAGYYFFAGNTTLGILLSIIALFLPFFDTFSTFNAYFQGKKDFYTYTTTGIAVQVGAVAVMLATIALTSNLFALVVAYFSAYTIFRFLAWRYTLKRYSQEGGEDPEMVGYGKHLSLMGVLGQAAAQADTLILFHFLGPVQVALYSVAIAAPEQLKYFFSAVNNLLLPRFSERSEHEIRHTIIFKCLLVLIVVGATIGAYIILAPFLFRLVLPKYQDAVFLSQLFSLSMLSIAFIPFGVAIQAHGHVREQYFMNTAVAIFQILSMTAGAMYMGLIGLVAARIATRYLAGIFGVYFFYYPLKKRVL